jgi:hypothetical protein
MKYLFFVGILIICVPALLFSDSGSHVSDSSSTSLVNAGTPRPLLIVGASALLPGAGQFYTRHYLKAGTFIALEAFTASFAATWNQIAETRLVEYHTLLNTVTLIDSGYVLADKIERAMETKHLVLNAEFKKYNAFSWIAGVYVYNLFDAFEATGLFRDTEARDPRKAFGLSAIPALGLGQVYNGSYSKAGLVMMTQVSMGIVAWNNHRLMKHAEANIERLSDTLITLPAIKAEYLDNWDGKRRIARTNRNMYLWYSVFTYVIGMLDAVVDAHLHDYSEKMKIEPDLVPYEQGAGMMFRVTF